MLELGMWSITVWLSICFSLLANSLYLSALKTSVSSLSRKSISHEHLHITDVSCWQKVFQLFHNVRFSSHFLQHLKGYYGAYTNQSFIIIYEIPRLYLNEFNRKIYPGRSQKRTLKNGSWISKMVTTIIYANYVLTSIVVRWNCQESV